jgi:hypothetical protein
MSLKRVGLLVVLLTLLLTSFSFVGAQNSCDKPFEGVSSRFSTNFWDKTDFCKRGIDLAEIRSGGPPPDGIPPVDNPKFETLAEAEQWLQPQSPVISLAIKDEARAYPLAILIWHEIVNDSLGDTPVAVTFCPLCNASIAFDRRVSGKTLRFGTTGNLRKSDLVMWDDLTQSWWQQFTGEAIVGSYTGTKLTFLSSQVVGFSQFKAQYPKGQVLSRTTGHNRDYGSNPYTEYDSTDRPFLFEGEVDKRLRATEHVLAATIEGQAVAYPFAMLAKEKVVNDTVGGEAVVALWQPGAASALDKFSIDISRDIGMAALYNRKLGNRVLTFKADDKGVIQDEQTKSTWNVFGTAIAGELKGQQLQPMIAAPHFWFAWAAFRPETTVYGLAKP